MHKKESFASDRELSAQHSTYHGSKNSIPKFESVSYVNILSIPRFTVPTTGTDC